MKITRTIPITLSLDECMHVVAEMVRTKPDIVNTVVAAGGNIHCPFPGSCRMFPCADLSCDADVCLNGYAYRMS